MGFYDGVKANRAINNRFQFAGLEPLMDILFSASRLFGILDDLEQGITTYGHALGKCCEQR